MAINSTRLKARLKKTLEKIDTIKNEVSVATKERDAAITANQQVLDNQIPDLPVAPGPGLIAEHAAKVDAHNKAVADAKAAKNADLVLKLGKVVIPDLPKGPTKEDEIAYAEKVLARAKLLRTTGAAVDAAQDVLTALINHAGVAKRETQLDHLAKVVETQEAAIDRKEAAYPGRLRSHLRRRANAGDPAAKKAYKELRQKAKLAATAA